MSAHAGQRGPGLWDEVCSPKMQRWTLLALADLFVINRPHTLAQPHKPGLNGAVVAAAFNDSNTHVLSFKTLNTNYGKGCYVTQLPYFLLRRSQRYATPRTMFLGGFLGGFWALLGGHAHRMLIRACNPMLCPMHVLRAIQTSRARRSWQTSPVVSSPRC